LLEYASPSQRFGAELGLRLDHLFLFGKDFSAHTLPALNPRLNVDFNIFKNRGFIDSLDITAGTGLFSSINSLVSFIDMSNVVIVDTLKFNRTWTSILGLKADVADGYSFNIEGYYKYVFDRGYITADTVSGINADFHFDGIGHVGGFDLQLQKLESRYWDGWISYTFTWAQYYDPSAGGEGVNMGGIDSLGAQWYYPSFHRYHNCNIVLNIKPLQWFNISTRIGFASGQLRTRTVENPEIIPYPVIYIDENKEQTIIQKYRRNKEREYTERAAWALPWDLKFSFFRHDPKGRVRGEIYLAAENLMSLFYNPERASDNTEFNTYTGKEYATGSGSSAFNFNFPLISFGFKWRY
jgi:hypothetical protein